MYDPRLGRWFNADPKEQYFSGYISMGNNPVSRTDWDGGWDNYLPGGGNNNIDGGGCSLFDEDMSTSRNGPGYWEKNGLWGSELMEAWMEEYEQSKEAISNVPESYTYYDGNNNLVERSWEKISSSKGGDYGEGKIGLGVNRYASVDRILNANLDIRWLNTKINEYGEDASEYLWISGLGAKMYEKSFDAAVSSPFFRTI